MAQLAIKGHPTRGKEVIKLLEMLGGKNDNHCCGGFIYRIYFINEYGYIESCDRMHHLDYFQLSLEEFLEKFPYKVGDKVIIKCKKQEAIVNKVVWCCDTITYWLKHDGIIEGNWRAEHLQPYKEETMEKRDKAMAPNLVGEDYSGKRFGYKIPQGYEFDCIKNNEIILKPKQPQYPKTYEECCEVMGIDVSRKIIYEEIPFYNEITLYEENIKKQLETLRKLRICRDAYWKIAGEQMGLDEPWKPDYGNDCDTKYIITVARNEIYKDVSVIFNYFLIFPTEEMQNAFYENFKDLIEECKQFL